MVLSDSERTVISVEERVKITAVHWSGVGNTLDVAVYNYGSDDTEIEDIYINGVRVQTYTSGRNEIILTEKIKRIVFTSPVTITLGESYTITVVTGNGISRTDNWDAES